MTRDRSRVVCEACHGRKVKCDLILRLKEDGICTNCSKRAETCIRREFKKAQRNSFSNQAPQSGGYANGAQGSVNGYSRSSSVPMSAILDQRSPLSSMRSPASNFRSPSITTNTPSEQQPGYLGEFSVMSKETPEASESMLGLGVYSKAINDQIIAATGAASLPPRPMIEALADAYFQYLHHRTPVVDRADIWHPQPSTLLLQSVCLAGSMLRHPKAIASITETEQFYMKAKTLFNSNCELDKLTTLKALCLIGLWNVTPSTVVTIDCSWSWLGLATRLGLQLGMHQESALSNFSNPSNARRVSWYLFVQDKLVSACFGRPEMLRLLDFNVNQLTAADFETDNAQARIFMAYTHLSVIIAKMLPAQQSKTALSSEEILAILEELKGWIRDLPQEIRLYESTQTYRAYRRDVYEVHIAYFTSVILFFHVCGQVFRPSTTARMSLVASSCMVRLYQEMDFRDDINYLLAMNNWYLMLAAVPQLNFNVGAHANDATCNEELDILSSVLRQRIIKFPGCLAIVETVEKFRSQHASHSPETTASGIRRDPERSAEYISIPAVQELFPFPKSMCPRMELLDEGSGDELEPFEDGPGLMPFEDWTYDLGDFSFLTEPFSS